MDSVITQYDSTNPAAIPDTAQQVVVYIDGLYRQVWADALAAGRFASTPKRRIACVTVNTPSDTADFERYDLNPPDVVPWHANMTTLGETNLWAYASRSERVAVEDAAWAAGIRDLSMWIATLDGTQVVAPYRYPVAAVQYTDTGSVDLSIVYQTFGPGGGTLGGVNLDMAEIVTGDNHDGRVYVTDWIVKRYITDPNALPGWYGNPSSVFPTVTAPRVVPAGVLGEVPDQVAATPTPEPKSVTGTFTGTLT